MIASMNVFCRRALFVLAATTIAFALSWTAPQTAWSQSTDTGTVVGTVTDTSNAVVPGASVTITLKSTAGVRSATTDNEGRYVFADVQPGVYDVAVTKQGFKSTVVTNQVVQVGLQLTENIKLQVGSVSTTVTVTEVPSAELQTLSPTVGSTLSGTVVNNLTNLSRDASTLAVLQPGQNINGNTGGTEEDQNSFQLDGGYATDDMAGDNGTYVKSFASDTTGVGVMHSPNISAAPSAVVPVPITSIQEFKVSTANQTADFNGGAGSQVELVTKRGTNTFHGTAYEYYLDDNFAGANTWDNNSTGTPQPGYHYSRFGLAAGGKIPHSNFLGGSWYIFGNYEGFRYPLNTEFEQDFPLPSLRAGIIHLNGQTIDLNPFPVKDPGCGTLIDQLSCQVTTTGQIIAPAMCPSGPCDPRGLGTTMNGTPVGAPNPVVALWNQYVPLPNDCSHGDGLNFCGYKGSISTPQSSNFGVARIDHDFGSKWHFNTTYHYYHLQNTVSDQFDVGGFFPGDTLGQYAAIRQEPQVPWLLTAGLTTDVTSTVTNSFNFSYTRNWWAYEDPGGPPNVAGYPAALEIGGEQQDVFDPYNTNNGSTRTRVWDGKDQMYRDDVTWLKGNHLFQLGGLFQRNNDTHTRNDNGSTINTYEQYLIGAGGGSFYSLPLSPYNISMTGYEPASIAGTANASEYDNLYSMVLGIVNQSQSLYTRAVGSLESGLPLNTRTSCAVPGIAATSGCISSPSVTNDSALPTYNGYFTDSWHLKPAFSLNYGLGYTVEMPPTSLNGGYEMVLVDQQNQVVSEQDYFNQVEQAALAGNAYAPLLGFSTVNNVQDMHGYPYYPFYGGLSPRIGFAWNFRPNTVIRAGYSRIFGRLNGIGPILLPMLTPGLMQPATCTSPNITGGCGTAVAPTTPLNAFRVGVDGTNAPLPAPVSNLPQPWYPGLNGVGTGNGETFDPNFKPNRSDEFTLSIQRQLNPKVLVEVGYIGRLISNEMQWYSLTAVPYMMTQAGQTFANAWMNVMLATNYGHNLSNIPVQPFFEGALGGAGSGYCTGYANCTAAFVDQNAGLMNISDPFDAWNQASGSFVFGRTMTSDPIAGSPVFGANGQSPSIITQASNGYGNYNSGYVQLTTTDWHGLTMKTNLSYSNALGTGTFIQATGGVASVNAWDLQDSYGPQGFNERWVFNFFINYSEPFFKNQNSWMGRLLGGWDFAPLFIAGSGFPIQLQDANGNCGNFGECNTAYIFAYENMVPTTNLHYSPRERAGGGPTSTDICGTAGAGYNVYSNPDETCPINGGTFSDPIRNPILGLDGQTGGAGPLTGLPFWNLDLGITKNIKIKERLSSSLYFDWTNVLNHMQPNDPCFEAYNISTWGVLGCGGNLQANQPRQLQLGFSLDW
jgi:hypothetical protein